MKLCIQDPKYSNSILLHESLLNACKGAICGGGTYAFVTADGVNLFLGDKIFSEFIKTGKYTLIIGMDDITNTRALRKIQELLEKYNENLLVYAFLHNTKGSTYHPKYSWFKTPAGGILVLGSGNLTQKGLRKNREVFNYIELNHEEIKVIENQWNEWFAENKESIKDIDAPEVKKRAEENAKNIKWLRRYKEKKNSDVVDQVAESGGPYGEINIEDVIGEEDDVWFFENDHEVLLAEIPKSNNRWKQANFNKDTFENFFGARCGENGEYRILLRGVNELGKLGETEVRPAVSVASKNYRFELNAASGLDYPENGRPIGIFAKVSSRTFVYELFMPNYNNYKVVLEFMDNEVGEQRNMRRIISYAKKVKESCPDLAIWNNLIEEEEII